RRGATSPRGNNRSSSRRRCALPSRHCTRPWRPTRRIDDEPRCPQPDRRERPEMKEPDEESRRRFLQVGSMLGLAAAFSSGTIGTAFAESKAKKEKVMAPTTAAQEL